MSNPDLCTALMDLRSRINRGDTLDDHPRQAIEDVIYLLEDKIHDLLQDEQDDALRKQAEQDELVRPDFWDQNPNAFQRDC